MSPLLDAGRRRACAHPFFPDRAISRDAQMYPDPDNFVPERFLKDGVLNPDVLDPRLYAFGHGRRRVLCSLKSPRTC